MDGQMKTAGGSGPKLTEPPMAGVPGPKGPVGPRETPGPKGPVGVIEQAGSTGPADAVQGPRMAQLDKYTVLQIELLSAKRKLAEADEQMGILAVQDARRRKQELNKEEAALMSRVSQQLGVETGSNIKLVDKEKGLCQVG